MPQDDVKPAALGLTDLQLRCLEGFWNRKPIKRIAADLGISEAWVNKNLMAARRHLNVGSSADAAAIVFGSKPGSIKNYYYQKTALSEAANQTDQALVGSGERLFAPVASERALINNYDVVQTIGRIFAVALGLIAGLLLVLQSAVGIHNLWATLGY
jgi:hypothetical protein